MNAEQARFNQVQSGLTGLTSLGLDVLAPGRPRPANRGSAPDGGGTTTAPRRTDRDDNTPSARPPGLDPITPLAAVCIASGTCGPDDDGEESARPEINEPIRPNNPLDGVFVPNELRDDVDDFVARNPGATSLDVQNFINERLGGGAVSGNGGTNSNEDGTRDGTDGMQSFLVDELISNGTRISPEQVIDIVRLDSGEIVWLETGNAAAGLEHIELRHAADFERRGIVNEQIPELIFEALRKGRIVDITGSEPNIRQIYEVDFNGMTQRIGIGVGGNGFIVTAFPS